MRRRAGSAIRVGIAALVVLAFAAVGTRAVARRLLFPTHRVAHDRAVEGGVPLSLVARDGVPVRAIWFPPKGDADVVVHFHNNRQTVADCVELARELRARGLGALLVEYRGYGLSQAAAAPTEDGLYLDAEAALDALAERGVPPSRVVLWGASLGSGVAAEMARRGRGAALVLVTPYTSIPDLATDVVPMLPAGMLVPDHFETLAKAGQIHVPTLVVHGDADEVVPFWMGVTLSRAIGGARLLQVHGGRHHDLLVRAHDRILAAVSALRQ